MEKQNKFNTMVMRPAANFFVDVGAAVQFVVRFFRLLFSSHKEWKEVYQQSYQLGVKSFLIISISGFIMGMVVALQSVPILTDFGATSMIPNMVAVSVVREIGPIVTGLICAGKLSSGIAAELGAMRVTGQIDAMKITGCRPFGYLVFSRVLSTTLVFPLLMLFADLFALFGGFIAVNLGGDVTLKLFFLKALDALTYADLIPTLVKSLVFGFIIGVVGAFLGYNVKGGTVAVGRVANQSVVIASLLIFLADLITVQLLHLF